MAAAQDIWLSFKTTLRGFDSPHQLALGLSLGTAIGLIPLDSVLPYALLALAILTPANLVCIAIGVLLGTAVSPVLDGITHPIGLTLLSFQPLASTWAGLYELPSVPWTRINNTVVVGNLVLGLISLAPVYLLGRGAIHWLAPPLWRVLHRIPLTRRWTRTLSPQLQES